MYRRSSTDLLVHCQKQSFDSVQELEEELEEGEVEDEFGDGLKQAPRKEVATTYVRNGNSSWEKSIVSAPLSGMNPRIIQLQRSHLLR